jgi:hypothetical protein
MHSAVSQPDSVNSKTTSSDICVTILDGTYSEMFPISLAKSVILSWSRCIVSKYFPACHGHSQTKTGRANGKSDRGRSTSTSISL